MSKERDMNIDRIHNTLLDTSKLLDEYNKTGATKHNLLWKAMGNVEDALKELEEKE